MFMRTQRLMLRPSFPEVWRDVYRGINDVDIVRMLARAPWPYREEDAKQYCAAKLAPMDVRMAITLPGEGGAPVIGQIGMDCAEDVPEVGYWIAREHHGRGYVSEALGGMMKIGRMLGVRQLQAGHYLDNPASGAVLRKAGFRETGEIRQTHALGRGGEMVLARRYSLDLGEQESDVVAQTSLADDTCKPA